MSYLAGNRDNIPTVKIRCLPGKQVLVDSGLKTWRSEPWMEEEAVAKSLEARGIVERVVWKARHVPENKALHVEENKLEGLTKKQLLKLAEEQGVAVKPRMRKAEIVEALR